MVTPAEAAKMPWLESILVIRDDENNGETSGEGDKAVKKSSVLVELKKGKSVANKKVPEDEDEAILSRKFINVGDVLPPLPKKGDFNVETIKKSRYFFS